MSKYRISKVLSSLVPLLLGLSLLAGCGPAPVGEGGGTAIGDGAGSGWQTGGSDLSSEMVAEYSAVTPVEAVQGFYENYLEYVRMTGNPMVDKAYQPDGTLGAFLTPEFVREVDEIIASFDERGGGFDPFLCAQDVPDSFEIVEEEALGERSDVTVRTSFAGHGFVVTVRLSEGQWKIDGVRPLSVQSSDSAGMDPDQVVEEFYGWYIDYVENQGNPLVDRPYRSSPHLSPAVIARMDEIIDGMEYGGYDPFLCAQDIPQIMSYRTVAVDGEQVDVAVRETWNGSYQDVIVTLGSSGQNDGQTENWQIVEITCPPTSENAGGPEYVVDVFFNWYIEYAKQVGNPLVDKTYQNGFLSLELVDRVEETLLSFGDGPGFDPILHAQDIPDHYVVEPARVVGDGATVPVMQLFSDQPRMIQVSLIRMGGWWQITDITPAERDSRSSEATTSEGTSFADEDEGFSLGSPAG